MATALQPEGIPATSDTFEMLFSYMEALNRAIPVRCLRVSIKSPPYTLQIEKNLCLPVSANEPYRILENTRATRDLLRQECDALERRLREANTLIRLYEFQRDEARRKVEVAEYCVGEVRARLQSNGIPIYHLHSVPTPLSVAPSLPEPTSILVRKISIYFTTMDLNHRCR